MFHYFLHNYSSVIRYKFNKINTTVCVISIIFMITLIFLIVNSFRFFPTFTKTHGRFVKKHIKIAQRDWFFLCDSLFILNCFVYLSFFSFLHTRLAKTRFDRLLSENHLLPILQARYKEKKTALRVSVFSLYHSY